MLLHLYTLYPYFLNYHFNWNAPTEILDIFLKLYRIRTVDHNASWQDDVRRLN